MEQIIFCSIIYLLFILFDLKPIAKSKDFKAFWFYTILLVLTYAVHLLVNFGVQIPSPADPIAKGIEALFNVRS
jgi:uncharacterized membrane protein